MYQQVYFHRTVRAIDLDLGEVFGPSIRAIFGDGSPADALGGLRRPRRVRPPPPGGPLGARRGARRATRRPATARCTGDGRRRLAGDPAPPADAGGPRPRSAPSTRPVAGPTRSIAEPRRRRSPAASRSTWPRSTRGRPTRPRPTACSRSRAATASPMAALARSAAAYALDPAPYSARSAAPLPVRRRSRGLPDRRTAGSASRAASAAARRRLAGRRSARGGQDGERVDPGDLDVRQLHPLHDSAGSRERRGLERAEQPVVDVAAGGVTGPPS